MMKLWEEVYSCIKEKKNILEIGCGIGDFVRFLASKGLNVTGIDPYASPEKGINYRIERAYGENLPFEDGSFDAIVSMKTLHHTDAEKMLKEAHRVMKHEGIICISDWKKGANTGINEEYFSLEEVKKMMFTAGFKNIGFFPCSDNQTMLIYSHYISE